jgi:dolichol-phosphate mannosyltransferase
MIVSAKGPYPDNKPLLSVCIPAYNEEGNVGQTIESVNRELEAAAIPHEFVIANDNSSDNTASVVRGRMDAGVPIRLINRRPPGGFGRAIRSCLDHFRGDVMVIVMADLSDDPADIVRYYEKINEGFDAVYGSRFARGSVRRDYPAAKLIANRFGNSLIQVLFRTSHNDLTNSFKAYRAEAIRSILPLYSSHFNVLIEISIGILIRDFRIAAMPVNWYGRTWGRANFRIRELARRYFATLFKVYAERVFIWDDVMAEHQIKTESLIGTGKGKEEVITNIEDQEDSDNGRRGVRGIESGVSI